MKYNDNGLWKDINIKVADTLPVGTIIPFAGSTLPANYMECDGSAISRIEYASLFAAIGTTYGSGDGSTTFNLPNLKGKVPVGYDSSDNDFDTIGETGGEKTHTLTTDEIPSHKHNTWEGANSSYSLLDSHATGASVSGYGANLNSITAKKMETSSIGGGLAHNNLQPYMVTKYIIKVLDVQAGGVRSETLPIGTEVEFEGNVSDIPAGWEQISEPANILWTNTTPTLDITTRTITLSSSDYDMLEIIYCYSKTNNESISSVRIPKGKSAQLLAIQPANSFSFVGRLMSYNSDTSYTIGEGLLCQGDNNTVTSNTTGCIPLYVIGYKTGLFS